MSNPEKQICPVCNGLGSLPDPDHPGSRIRCPECGGTGLVDKPAATPTRRSRAKSTNESEE